MLLNSIFRKSISINCSLSCKQCRYFGLMLPFLNNKTINRNRVVQQVMKVFYSVDIKKNSQNFESDKQKKPKKEIKTYITLISVDNLKTITTIDEAKKISNRRNLNLIKLSDVDSKSGRAVYQLISGSDYAKTDSSWSQSIKEPFIKGVKVVSFTSNINENDLLTKIKMIMKWLAKQFEVRVIITGDTNAGEKIYAFIAKELGTEARILQKRTKADIRFQIVPPKKKE